MNENRIYHGGPITKKRFPAPAVSPGPNPDTIRMNLDPFSFHASNSNPATRALHTTPNDSSYGYETWDFDKGDGVFALFGLPNKLWGFTLAGATGITVDWHFYHEQPAAAPNNDGYFNTNLYIVRQNESFNFAKAGGQFLTLDCSFPAYNHLAANVTNYQVVDPSGAGTVDEQSLLYVKLRREFTGDTFPTVIRFLGMVIEFPLV